MFLEECKIIVQEKKISRYINNDLKIFSDDFSKEEDTNEETSDEKETSHKEYNAIKLTREQEKNNFIVDFFFERAICIVSFWMILVSF